MENPKLEWTFRNNAEGTGPPITGAFIPSASSLYSGWYVENPNPRPIVIEQMTLTAYYSRPFGGRVERSWTITGRNLGPGQEFQVKPFRTPWFSSLSSHTLDVVVRYGNARFKLGNYRRTNLFEPHRTLTLWFHDRILS